MFSSFRIAQPKLPNLGFQDEKYRTTVDVLHKHLSGILVIKKIEPQAYRVVFMNELGVTFFDYSFFENHYVVNQIMDKLNKKAVKRTLAKDFGMLLGEGIFKKESAERKDSLIQVSLQRKGQVHYYFQQKQVERIELHGRKKVVSIYPFYKDESIAPDSVFIQHHTVNFTIQLKKMYVAE
jgi:hypothetical protein